MMLRVLVTQWNAETIPATLATIEAAGATVVGVESEDAAKTSAQLQNLQPDVLLTAPVMRACWPPRQGRVTRAKN
jgi:AmiR/NasT family two-component response regulator